MERIFLPIPMAGPVLAQNRPFGDRQNYLFYQTQKRVIWFSPKEILLIVNEKNILVSTVH